MKRLSLIVVINVVTLVVLVGVALAVTHREDQRSSTSVEQAHSSPQSATEPATSRAKRNRATIAARSAEAKHRAAKAAIAKPAAIVHPATAAPAPARVADDDPCWDDCSDGCADACNDGSGACSDRRSSVIDDDNDGDGGDCGEGD